MVNVTTDRSPSFTGKNKGLLKKIIDKVHEINKDKNIIFLHCIIHQEAFCRKVLNVSHVVDTLTQIVNYIRKHGLNHRQFINFLETLQSEHTDVPYHTHVRWLSLGKVFSIVWNLRTEIKLFLEMKEKSADFPQLFDDNWIQ